MNRDDIIKMAQDSGFSEAWLSAGENPPHFEAPAVIVERFFHMAQAAERSNWPAEMEAMERQVNILTDELAKAVAAEREACAKVCDEIRHPWGFSAETSEWCRGTEHCAEAIRARGQA